MLELLREADLMLSPCGRPVPPPGVRWVDIPGGLVFQQFVPGTNDVESPPTGIQQNVGRLVNTYRTPIIIRGMIATTAEVEVGVRFTWPDGRYLQRELTATRMEFAEGPREFVIFPEVLVNPGDKIKVELNRSLFDPSVSDANTELCFNGALRFLLKATGDEPAQIVPDLSDAPRIRKGPNQNILAPEFYQGEQCYPETPAGFEDEVFLLQSELVAVPIGQLVPDQVIRVPGDCVEFLGRHISFEITQDETVTEGRPLFNLRLPSGYAITGGDFVNSQITGPQFPELVASGGGRIIFDVSTEDTDNIDEEGNFYVRININGAKRRAI